MCPCAAMLPSFGGHGLPFQLRCGAKQERNATAPQHLCAILFLRAYVPSLRVSVRVGGEVDELVG